MRLTWLSLPLIITLSACDNSPALEQGANEQGHTSPSAVTVKANQAMLQARPFANTTDFDNARKGLIAQDDSLITQQIKTICWRFRGRLVGPQ